MIPSSFLWLVQNLRILGLLQSPIESVALRARTTFHQSVHCRGPGRETTPRSGPWKPAGHRDDLSGTMDELFVDHEFLIIMDEFSWMNYG